MKKTKRSISKTVSVGKRISLVLIFLALSLTGQAQNSKKTDSLIHLARLEMGKLNFRDAGNYLKEAERIDSLNAEVIYLYGEMHLLLGSPEFLKHLDKLKAIDSKEYYHVLKLKHALFIGLGEADTLLKEYLDNYPENPEIKFAKWLSELDKGHYEKCKLNAKKISDLALFKYAPYLGLYVSAWDHDYNEVLAYMDTIENILERTFWDSKYREVLQMLPEINIIDNDKGIAELPFAWCGSGIGFYMIDEKGDSLKIELDTGTAYNLMTVHDKTIGENISGTDVLVIENGISYNYMEKPADMHYKKSNFSVPAMNNIIFGYFESNFFKADGCTSPFVFENRAIHMDPINEKVYLFDQENMERYINENKNNLEIVPYVVRNGWIFIPCKINGTEVLMQVETGSRDVVFNTISIDALGLESYAGFIEWNGQDFPVDKVDCVLEIGNIKYEVKGGLVFDNAMANWYYGVASAGDIGPFFMNQFVYTIDPFNQQIIFEIS